jgi:hypothetical protein
MAGGPLVVSRTNGRYFTVASDERRAVYLTGSHIWNNLHDGMGPGPEGPADPERFDFDGYLRFRRQLPPQHDAPTLGTDRSRARKGRQAAL